MKKTIVIAFIMFTISAVKAQTKKNEFVFYPKELVSSVLYSPYQYWGYNSGVIENYMFGYRRYLTAKNALRLGIYANSVDRKNKTNDTNVSANLNQRFKIGVGFEHHFPISKAWDFYLGADYIYNQNANIYDYNFTTSSQSTYSKSSTVSNGAYPFMGVVAKLHERISICFDSGFLLDNQIEKVNSVTRKKSDQSIISQTTSNNTEIGFSYILPSIQFRLRL